MFSQASIAALSAKLLPRITFGLATADATATSSLHGLPTLDELGTGWLDCGLLAQMPSLHNFQEVAACAPDLVAGPFLRRTQAAVYEGVYAQAREFYGPKRRDRDAPVRIAQRQGCMRECAGGGAFAETVVCTLFGYLPKFGGTPELLNADTPRGLTGELRHVCCGAQRYTIQFRETGLMLEIES
jgi:hypothetical protein